MSGRDSPPEAGAPLAQNRQPPPEADQPLAEID